MSLSDDLLEQARMLATCDTQRPRQANLRRAVSSAYYALFHFIGDETAKVFIGATPRDQRRRALARRAISHTHLKTICKEFSKKTPRPLLKPYWPNGGFPFPELETICNNFINLQEFRHQADYDFSSPIKKRKAIDACAQAQMAMNAWDDLKHHHPDAFDLFTLSILLLAGHFR